MIILTIRTDKPEAEIGLYDDQKQLAYDKWQAHRLLAETIHQKIQSLLNIQSITLHQVEGIVVFEGPGSFTGLRIGVSVAGALAYGLNIPIVSSAEDWLESGIARLLDGQSEKIPVPNYGAPATTTKQRK